jgi:hypothetical protein
VIVTYALLSYQLIKLLGMIGYRISLWTSQDTENSGKLMLEQTKSASNRDDSELSPDMSSKNNQEDMASDFYGLSNQQQFKLPNKRFSLVKNMQVESPTN